MLHTRRKKLILAMAPAFAGFASAALAQPHAEEVEEIIVTAPFQRIAAETALPIGVLSGEELREKVANSLGDTLKNEIGINSASFGASLGHPVIRGQTGNRVSILQNGVGVTDASNVSPDHAEGVETVLAERLEVIRGPSTLLYGSGAVGGAINVIDNRIPEELVEQHRFSVEQSHNTVNDADQTVFRLAGAAGPIAINLNAFKRKNQNVNIDGFAIDEVAVQALEDLIAEYLEHGHDEGEQHDDEEGHEEEEFENTFGFIGNSHADAQGGTAGFSFIGDSGFFGFSVSDIDNNYGLPPGTHSHANGHEDEHDEEGQDEEHGEEVEFVRINMNKTRYDARGMLRFSDSWVDNIRVAVGYTDYQHKEIEIFSDGDSEVGTLYSNEGVEGRFTLERAATGPWSGVYGLQWNDTDFSAIGEEAFIPPAAIVSTGFFGVERFTGGNMSVELGLRVESNEVEATSTCGFDDTALSLSGSVLYDLSAGANLLFGLSRSERAPTVEELLSNVASGTCLQKADDEELILHAATGLLEIGNPNLDKETANNIELGFRQHVGPITGELSAYRNEIDDYIFLDLTGEEFEEQPIARYLARDAVFTGLEGKVSFNLLETEAGTLAFGLFGDLVNAKFDAGGNVPRIPPAKLGAELRYYGASWTVHLHATRAFDQDDAGELELPTQAYTSVSLYADYHWLLAGDSELTVFLKGENLLDEEIRNHASFLKHFAPEPGRGFRLGLRFEY